MIRNRTLDRSVFRAAGALALAAAVFAVLAAATGDRQPRRVAAVVDVKEGYLLGGSVDGRWMDAKTFRGNLRGRDRYRVYGASGLLGPATGTRPKEMEEICPETYSVAFSPRRSSAEIAVGGAWNALPRAVERLDPRGATYREAVRQVLIANGIARPEVRVTGAWRVDLEGDGVNEVVVSATRGDLRRGIHVEAGDYSTVFVRKVVNGTVRTVPLQAEYFPVDADTLMLTEYSVAGILDLDGDGTMEIVMRGRYYEGSSTTVYRLRGTRKQELATAGCGV